MGNYRCISLSVALLLALSATVHSQNVGIGTTSPASKLDISGGLTVGATYAGTNAAPANGALIEGNVGIGTVLPSVSLDVNGQIRMRTGAVNGYIPVGDANGVMTWTDPATLLSDDFWKTSGNTGTNPNSNYIGTADAQDLVFRTNGAEHIRIQTSGNVEIGTGFDDARLFVKVNNTDLTTNDVLFVHHDGGITTGDTRGLAIYNNNATGDDKYGINILVDNSGTGGRFGINNTVNLNSASTASAIGVRNIISALSSTGGDHYGQLNQLTSDYGHPGLLYGEYTYLGPNAGGAYGEYKELYSSSISNGHTFGDYNWIHGDGDGKSYGVYNEISVTATGEGYGVKNLISNGEGPLYGVYNDVSSGSSSGNNVYGVYSNISSAGIGNVYGVYINASGGSNAYAALFNTGHVVANESGGDYDFRVEGNTDTHLLFADASTDRIGIDNASPDVKFHIGGGTDVAVSGGGYLQTGLSSGANIGIDNNEIMARNNGATSTLYIQNNGGYTYFGDKVGIGTTTPDQLIEVSQSGYSAARITSTNSVESALEFLRVGGGSDWRIINSGGLLFFGQSNNDLSTVNEVVRMGGSSLTPASDNTVTLGSSSLRWTTVYAASGTVQTSDERDKIKINSLSYGLKELIKLRPVVYRWKDHPETGEKIGFIAQDIQKVIPEVVMDWDWKVDEETGERKKVAAERLGIYYSDLIPVLTKAIQEQQVLIESLQSQISELQNKIEYE